MLETGLWFAVWKKKKPKKPQTPKNTIKNKRSRCLLHRTESQPCPSCAAGREHTEQGGEAARCGCCTKPRWERFCPQGPGGSSGAGSGALPGRRPGAGGLGPGSSPSARLAHAAEPAGPAAAADAPAAASARHWPCTALPRSPPLPERRPPASGLRAFPGSRGEPGGGARELPERALPASGAGAGPDRGRPRRRLRLSRARALQPRSLPRPAPAAGTGGGGGGCPSPAVPRPGPRGSLRAQGGSSSMLPGRPQRPAAPRSAEAARGRAEDAGGRRGPRRAALPQPHGAVPQPVPPAPAARPLAGHAGPGGHADGARLPHRGRQLRRPGAHHLGPRPPLLPLLGRLLGESGGAEGAGGTGASGIRGRPTGGTGAAMPGLGELPDRLHRALLGYCASPAPAGPAAARRHFHLPFGRAGRAGLGFIDSVG